MLESEKSHFDQVSWHLLHHQLDHYHHRISFNLFVRVKCLSLVLFSTCWQAKNVGELWNHCAPTVYITHFILLILRNCFFFSFYLALNEVDGAFVSTGIDVIVSFHLRDEPIFDKNLPMFIVQRNENEQSQFSQENTGDQDDVLEAQTHARSFRLSLRW